MAEQLNAIMKYLHAEIHDRTVRRHYEERSELRNLTKQVNLLVRKVSGLQMEFNQFKGERSSTTVGQGTSGTGAPTAGSRYPAKRTADNRKHLCFECRKPGHIARNCVVRRQRLALEEDARQDEQDLSEEPWDQQEPMETDQSDVPPTRRFAFTLTEPDVETTKRQRMECVKLVRRCCSQCC